MTGDYRQRYPGEQDGDPEYQHSQAGQDPRDVLGDLQPGSLCVSGVWLLYRHLAHLR